jgi:hypothetical protein
VRIPVLIALSATTVAACTSSTQGTPTGPASGRATSSATVPASSSASAAPAPLTAATARAALLGPGDLGPGFVKAPFQGGGSNTASPCLPAGSPSLDTKYPPAARAQVGFRSAAPQALLGEQVALYRDAGTARAVISYAERALSCKSATVQGQKVQIQASGRLRQVDGEPVDYARSWALAVGPAAASIVAVRLGRAVLSMELVALSRSDVSKLPPEEKVIAAAVRKAKRAL